MLDHIQLNFQLRRLVFVNFVSNAASKANSSIEGYASPRQSSTPSGPMNTNVLLF